MIYIVSYPESTFDECWMFCAISDFTKLELAFPNEWPSLNPSISWVETSKEDSSLYS